MAVRRTLIQTVKGKKDGGTFDPQQFSKDISKAYKEKSVKYTRKYSFSPSTLVYGNGTCARYWYFAFTGADFERTVDAAGAATMANGTDAGIRLAKVVEKAGRLVEAEREVKTSNPPVRGFIDIVVDQDGKEILGEIKTIRDDLFQGVTDAHEPKPYHLLQILLYMYLTDHDEGFIMYENKNTQEICVMPVILNDRTKAIVERAIDWMKKVREAYEKDTIPEHGFAETSYQCKGCPVRKACWGEERSEISIPNLVI